ncbi:hypothetical protein SRHO_G00112900 [Serrasalmus rhombeus]
MSTSSRPEADSLVGAIDQGTSSTRFLVFNAKTAELISQHQVEINQSFPKEGWVEEDPKEILQSVCECMERTSEKLIQLNINISNVKAIGVTNQRETTVVWDKETGEPLYNAIASILFRRLKLLESTLLLPESSATLSALNMLRPSSSTAVSGMLPFSHDSVTIMMLHSLIHLCVVVYSRSSSILPARARTLARNKLGTTDRWGLSLA